MTPHYLNLVSNTVPSGKGLGLLEKMANSRSGANNIYNETVASYGARVNKKGQANRNAMMRSVPMRHGSRLKELRLQEFKQ